MKEKMQKDFDFKEFLDTIEPLYKKTFEEIKMALDL